ncbi:hypothetical protein Ndes2437B_g03552 [Nannochloris sp. 'desiccata']
MNDHILLLIIAHPDDECMFFLPALTHFRKQAYTLHVLCLSTGNAGGLGAIRRQELFYSCSVLGIERSSVTVIDDTRLPDGMAAAWPLEVVGKHVEAAIEKYSATTVLTFDNKGVSGHQNHISTSQGVLYSIKKLRRDPSGQFTSVKLYMLATNGFLRKYIFPLDLFLFNLYGFESCL